MNAEQRIEALAEWVCKNPQPKDIGDVPAYANDVLDFLSTLGCYWKAEDQTGPFEKYLILTQTRTWQRVATEAYKDAGFVKVE